MCALIVAVGWWNKPITGSEQLWDTASGKGNYIVNIPRGVLVKNKSGEPAFPLEERTVADVMVPQKKQVIAEVLEIENETELDRPVTPISEPSPKPVEDYARLKLPVSADPVVEKTSLGVQETSVSEFSALPDYENPYHYCPKRAEIILSA